MPDQTPTGRDARDENGAPQTESSPTLTEAKRSETSDRHYGEQYDEEYEAYKLKAKEAWKNFQRGGPKWVEAICAIFLVIITGGYTFVAWHQWHEMMRTNNLTQKAIHSSGRAWVGVESFTPISFDRDDQGAMLTVTFTLKNYGHSAAEHIRIFPELDVLSSPAATTGVCDDSKSGIDVGDVLLLDQKRDYPWGTKITTEDIESALRKQNPVFGRNILGLVVRGCLEYIDDPTEKTPHHTPFSFFVMRPLREGYITPETKHIPGNKLAIEAKEPLKNFPVDIVSG